MKRLLPLCLALLLVPAVEVTAETIVFNTTELTTSGTFFCRPEPACSPAGSSVTLGTGPGAVTLSFTGVSTLVPISNEAVPVTLGTLSSSSSSATFPTRTNPNLPIVGLVVTLTQSAPAADTGSFSLLFGPGGKATLPLLIAGSYKKMSPGPVPPGYDELVYSYHVPAIPMNGSADITAEAGVIPEPATMVLVGLGLAGAAVRRRKRDGLVSGR